MFSEEVIVSERNLDLRRRYRVVTAWNFKKCMYENRIKIEIPQSEYGIALQEGP